MKEKMKIQIETVIKVARTHNFKYTERKIMNKSFWYLFLLLMWLICMCMCMYTDIFHQKITNFFTIKKFYAIFIPRERG